MFPENWYFFKKNAKKSPKIREICSGFHLAHRSFFVYHA